MDAAVNKNRATDIVIKLRRKDGSTNANADLVDKKLLTGENHLHALMDKQTTLWRLAYDNGVLPGPLKTQFTSFPRLYQAVENYMIRRNIEITEVID